MESMATMATVRRRLSAVERGIIRQAVSKHPDWNAWRSNVLDTDGKPVNTSTISVEQLYDAATAFGIDVEQAIANAGYSAIAERPERAERQPAAAPSSNGKIPSRANAADDASQLASVLQSILSKPVIDETAVRSIVDEAMASAAPQLDEATINAMIDLALESKAIVQTINLPQQSGKLASMEGHFHPQYATLLKVVACKVNVWITGPTGSGKTHAARQVAEALSLSLERTIPFYVQGGMSQPHEMLGFVLPGSGQYVTTPFRQAWEHGGVILFDECDTYDPAVSLAMNAALANGHGVFPDRPDGVPRHEDCYIIAAANTWGSGATSEFVGRNKLDAAFLSRFPVKLAWPYDDAFELAISGNASWAKRVQSARRKAAERGLKVIIDPRHSIAGAALIAAGFSEDETADMTYKAGLTEQQRKELP